MRLLIVNADDYCRTPSVSAGIRHAHLNGLVSTTTCMMNFDTALADIQLARSECPRLGLGVHLTLTAGRPVLPPAQVASLVDSRGAFLKLDRLEASFASVDPAHLRAEWRAQIERFLASGARLDHLDSHHHTSYYNETALGVMLDLAREYDAPVRRPRGAGQADPSAAFADRLLAETGVLCPDHFITEFYDGGATLAGLLAILAAVPNGATEIMSHPGYVDDELLRGSSYNRQREREIDILTSSEARAAIANNGLQLVTFRGALE